MRKLFLVILKTNPVGKVPCIHFFTHNLIMIIILRNRFTKLMALEIIIDVFPNMLLTQPCNFEVVPFDALMVLRIKGYPVNKVQSIVELNFDLWFKLLLFLLD